jgi:two-component system, chemotaxis family, sensor kinase CheA
MHGKETELDRTILEAVKDPLTHVVRNAIDHGIEVPAARASRGKPRTGSLVLRAFHEGGQVIIEVSDDGNGLDTDAIRKKALERNLVPAEQIARMSDHELAQLVFLPGFSTAQQVTNVSGRGVGMDVVKTNVERIGGTVDLLSRPRVGTTLRIRIPLTLAIIPALMVAQGDHRYAIPQANLVELVRIEGAATRTAIERIHSSPVYRLRGQLLPIVDLGVALGTTSAPPAADIEDARLNIVVLQADDRMFGVIIDDIRDTEEIVVKPLGTELKGIAVFAGATIMGDGQVSLILDVVGLAQHAGVARARKDDSTPETRSAQRGVISAIDTKQALLLFAMRDSVVVALPLAEVARLEELSVDQLECTRNGFVVQHRGGILPLVDLVGVGQRKRGDSLSVIVYTRNERSIGLIVERIVDVVDEVVRLEQCGTEGDVLGAAIVQGKITELVDLQAVIGRHAPWFFEAEAA